MFSRRDMPRKCLITILGGPVVVVLVRCVFNFDFIYKELIPNNQIESA